LWEMEQQQVKLKHLKLGAGWQISASGKLVS